MGALEGDIKTPFGSLSKKTGLFLAAGTILVFGYTWYRAKQSSAAAASATAGANDGIDPATGYAYGSAEDAAALTAQAAYISPSTSGGGGGTASGAYPSGSFATNAAWAQAALQYMQSSGALTDETAFSTAIGKYLTGSPLSDAEKSLVEQAIAFEGYPPVPGPAGYPPSINTGPVVVTPPTTGGGTGTTPPASGGYDLSKWQAKGSVSANQNVNAWIRGLISSGAVPPNFTYENTLLPRNAGIDKNINWHANSDLNTFKKAATYNLKW